jgi:hypothetical protein
MTTLGCGNFPPWRLMAGRPLFDVYTRDARAPTLEKGRGAVSRHGRDRRVPGRHVPGRLPDRYLRRPHAAATRRTPADTENKPYLTGTAYPTCANTKHWQRGADSHVCALCAEGGPAEIVGVDF